MAMAKAFATTTPRPTRSVLFVWHAGEERGLWGSRYFADYPTVPIDHIVAQLNIDMIGRNRDDKPSEDQHGLSGRIRSHQQRAPSDQSRRQRALLDAR